MHTLGKAPVILWGFLLLLCISTTTQASDSLILEVQVESGFVLDIPESFLISSGPDQTISDTLPVQVKTNVPWSLTVNATGDMPFVTEIQDVEGTWRDISLGNVCIAFEEAATGDAWVTVNMPVQVAVDFQSPAGAYQVLLEFTVVPEI